jgi:hypothetical protein
MKLKKIISAFYPESGIPELVEKAIPDSEANFPGTGKIPFLTDDFLRKYAELAQIPAEIINGFLKTKETLLADEKMTMALWHFQRILYECGASNLPDFQAIIPEYEHCISLILILSGCPGMEKIYSEKDYPHQVFLDSISDIGAWVKQWFNEDKVCGVRQKPTIAWEMNLLTGKIFRLGRLEFHTYEFGYDVHLFKNRSTGEIQALAGDNTRYNRQGLIDGVENKWDEEDHWFSSYTETGNKAAGNPVSPDGYAHPQKIELDLNEWEVVLQKGDQAINIHIPADGPMTLEACVDSFSKALEFFPEFFPECKFKTFCCFSWMFDPEFSSLLKETSNIIKLQKIGYMLPFHGNSEAISRVFGWDAREKGIDAVPHDSGMRKAFAAFLRSGGIFHNGMWLLFPWQIKDAAKAGSEN